MEFNASMNIQDSSLDDWFDLIIREKLNLTLNILKELQVKHSAQAVQSISTMWETWVHVPGTRSSGRRKATLLRTYQSMDREEPGITIMGYKSDRTNSFTF